MEIRRSRYRDGDTEIETQRWRYGDRDTEMEI